MKNIVRYLMISIFLTMLYIFATNILNDPPYYMSEVLISIFAYIKNLSEKPFWIFSLFFDIKFIEDNSLFFAFIIFLIISIPITLFFSDKVNDFAKYENTQRPYILTEYEYIDKEQKDNVYPIKKIDRFLDKIGLLKRTNIEKETMYNISIYLPEDVRKIFSYQVKRIKKVDRVFIPESKNEMYAFIEFNSVFGFNSIKYLFSINMLKNKKAGNEFILATVIFKDKNYENLFIDVWVKNLKLDKMVFRSNNDININQKYDYKYSSTKINPIIKD